MNTPIRSCLRIAAAQIDSVPLDIDSNLQRHLDFIDMAHAHQVSLLVFPELSLTGYELPGMPEVAMRADDARLDVLRERARQSGMTIVVGAPLANREGLPSIGALTFSPDGSTGSYRKRFLHDGEAQFVQAGTALTQLHRVRGISIALAVCADVVNSQHPHAASISGAELYAIGSVITPGGYAKDSAQLAGYAALYDMDVLLANPAYRSGPFECAGRSAIWCAGGQLAVAAPGQGECLVLASFNEARVVEMAPAQRA